jgi:hybrid cluster-associated redox disulfide protein
MSETMTEIKIDYNTKFGELLRMKPEIGKVLKEKFGLCCVGCGGAEQETLRQGARAHGLDVDAFIEDLRKYL